MSASGSTPRRTPGRTGLALGLSAYLMWGGFPLYFPLLAPAGSVEIIAHRVVWSLVVCAVLLTATRGWGPFVAAVRHRRTLALLSLGAALIAVNWLVYVYAVLSDQVVDASLGYFLNPLVTVLLAVFVLGERVRPVQWVALGFGALAVVVIVIGVARLPWVALTLATSFGLYGLIKNRVGRTVNALAGLGVETAVLFPLALAYLVWLQATGTGHFTGYGSWHAVALMCAGVLTATPLLLFSGAARRLPLRTIGMLQYLTPMLQFILGLVVFHEQMPAARWAGFALVWVALVILTVDGLRTSRLDLLAQRAANGARIEDSPALDRTTGNVPPIDTSTGITTGDGPGPAVGPSVRR
ncbi:EamA family transporter RarD [Cellulomonas sp. P24]|uniref:EamA family transporter RarD n=1 Tax=Cellulomonas sp. P24 TaxID=2885206 RepID=UPI00216B4752|nr:EamA family transporter RarD [Cellulomonas sp. P24]MCR6492318.1 EamA family transporter RarD [Cellulomonas sp. P24]